MSNSLLKKSLQLFDQDIDYAQPKGKSANISMENAQKLVSTKRIGHKKEICKLKRHQQEKLKKLKKNKTVEDEYHKYCEWDNTEDNLHMIAKMSQLDSASPDVVQNVVQYNKGKFSKNRKKEEVKSSQQQSVFSDRDFDQFEKEYDVDFWDK